MKYNHGKIKKEHHILPEFMPLLLNLEKESSVQRIIPGRVSRQQKGSSRYLFSVSYPTQSGIKCLMKKGSTVQELFLIGDSALLMSMIEQYIS